MTSTKVVKIQPNLQSYKPKLISNEKDQSSKNQSSYFGKVRLLEILIIYFQKKYTSLVNANKNQSVQTTPSKNEGKKIRNNIDEIQCKYS